MPDISLLNVDPFNLGHTDILYELLLSRQHSISHASMPSLKDHRKFCESNPYRYWYIALEDQTPFGSVYVLGDNSVGINIDDSHCKHSTVSSLLSLLFKSVKPLPPIPSVRPPDFFVNVPASNIRLQCALRQEGYELTAHTFRLAYLGTEELINIPV